MFKKWIAVILAVTLVALSGCGTKKPSSSSSAVPSLSVSSKDVTSATTSEPVSAIQSSSSSSSASSISSASSKKTITSSTPKVTATINTIGFKNSNGRMTIQGDWIYYRNVDDNGKLYKINTNGTGKQKLDDQSTFVCRINVVGDWVYYCASTSSDNLMYDFLCKVRTNGTGRRELEHLQDECYPYILFTNNTLYFCNSSAFYKMNNDGSGKTKILDSPFLLNNTNILYDNNDFYIAENHLVWTGVVSKPEGITDNQWALIKIKSNGAGKQILQSGKNNREGTSDVKLISGGWLYYRNSLDSALYKCKTDGSSNQKLNYQLGTFFDGTWSYYSDNAGITKIKADGTGKQQIVKAIDSIDLRLLADGWLYFSKFTDHKTYQIKTDGTGLRLSGAQVGFM